MVEAIRHESNFIGYEYSDVTVSREMERVYMDGYENFGWQYESSGLSISSPLSVVLRFKRDRKLRNKAELTRLQRQFDACARDIVAMERSKTTLASTVAYIIGIVGTAFMAGSVFAVTSGLVALCAILAVPGFVGWILPYFVYSMIQRKKTAEMAPLIEGKYDEIYEVCEKANGLLNK